MLKNLTTKISLGLTGAALTAGTAFGANIDAQNGATAARGNLTDTSLSDQVATITNLMIMVIGIISVIMLIIGGFRYVLSGGDSKNTTAAKDTILYAIIGIVVALLAYSIVNFVIGKIG